MDPQNNNLPPPSPPPQRIRSYLAVGIIVLIVISISLTTLILSREKFSLPSFAKEDTRQYDGLLVEIEGGRCEGTEKTICHRLVYENDYKRVVSVGAQTGTVRSELKSAAGSGKRVTIRGIETEYKKDNKKIPYILAKKVIIREDKPVTATQTVRIGMGGGVPLDEKCVDPKDKNRRCLLDDLGIKHAVTGVFWSVIEQDQGKYNWGAMTESERKIAECNRLGIDCSVLITNAPAWAVSEATKKVGKYCPDYPIDEADYKDANAPFGKFIQGVVERYDGDGNSDGIDPASKNPLVARTFVLYNEPDEFNNNCVHASYNSGSDWNNNGKVDVEDYAELLVRAYKAAKNASDKAVISFGAIATFDQVTRKPLIPSDQPDFVGKVLKYLSSHPQYKADIQYPFYDLMHFHYYDYADSFWASYDPGSADQYTQGGIRSQANYFMKTMKQYGGDKAVKPIVISEIGDSAQHTATDEKAQAIAVFKVLTEAASMDFPYIDWYTFAAQGGRPELSGYELVEIQSDGALRKRPSYEAYKRLVPELNGQFFYDTDINSVDIEGYIFKSSRDLTTTKTKEVLWKRTPGIALKKFRSVKSVTLLRSLDPADTAAVVINDAAQGDKDGIKNGSITIEVTDIPVLAILN